LPHYIGHTRLLEYASLLAVPGEDDIELGCAIILRPLIPRTMVRQLKSYLPYAFRFWIDGQFFERIVPFELMPEGRPAPDRNDDV
jgi:hypothetical protein